MLLFLSLVDMARVARKVLFFRKVLFGQNLCQEPNALRLVQFT